MTIKPKVVRVFGEGCTLNTPTWKLRTMMQKPENKLNYILEMIGRRIMIRKEKRIFEQG